MHLFTFGSVVPRRASMGTRTVDSLRPLRRLGRTIDHASDCRGAWHCKPRFDPGLTSGRTRPFTVCPSIAGRPITEFFKLTRSQIPREPHSHKARQTYILHLRQRQGLKVLSTFRRRCAKFEPESRTPGLSMESIRRVISTMSPRWWLGACKSPESQVL